MPMYVTAADVLVKPIFVATSRVASCPAVVFASRLISSYF